MKNERLRNELKKRGVCIWEAAERLGISEATMTRKLRHELPEEEVNRIVALMEKEEG